MKLAGIYIHIPFCRSRCSYCDFATGLYETSLVEHYLRALVREILLGTAVSNPGPVDTIYFGGGTPSLLCPSQINQILETVQARFDLSEDAEVTLELNPGKLTVEILKEFRALGINRASFGAQTFDDRELSRLGRSHSVNDIRQTFRHLRDAGFRNINFDLIAGLPGQTLDGWKRNLDQALTLGPEHLSFYLLEVHEGTPLAKHIRRGVQPEPDEDMAAKMYMLMLDWAAAVGYRHYEISNLCLPGFESRHNTKYWTGAPYFGFGCSAHSYDGHFRRWSNERDVSRYTSLIASGQSPVVENVILSPDEVRAEALFLGLRLMAGVDMLKYQELFGADPLEDHAQELSYFREAGLIELDGDLLKLTRSGALFSNEVFAAFV